MIREGTSCQDPPWGDEGGASCPEQESPTEGEGVGLGGLASMWKVLSE